MTTPLVDPAAQVEFCLLAEAGALEAQALLLCESLRTFGGAYARSPITVVSPRTTRRPSPATIRALEALDVDFTALDLMGPTPEYGPSYRVLALGRLSHQPGPPVLIQLDSDTLFIAEPDLGLDGAGCAARPVDVQGMCSTGPGDPHDGLWRRMCEACGVALDGLPFVETTVDRVAVRASYNAGLVAAPRATFAVVESMFRRIVAAEVRPYLAASGGFKAGAGQVSKAGYEHWGTSQAAISIALASLDQTCRVLPGSHNVPLHSFDDLAAPPDRFVHLHYHWLLDDLAQPNPLLDGRIPLGPAQLEWLLERAPLRVGRSIEPTGARSRPVRRSSPVKARAATPEREAVRREFDPEFYLEAYPDVRVSGLDPFDHFMTSGWIEGRDPAPWFSLEAYQGAHADVVERNVNPFEHFVLKGRTEGRALRPQPPASPSGEIRPVVAREALVVTGMHRSGTSLMARLLSFAGSDLPRRLIAPSAGNPRGFWEPEEIVRLNDQMLAAVGSRWDNAFGVEDNDRVWALRHAFAASARSLFAEAFEGAVLPVLKDPRLARTSRFWTWVLEGLGVAPLHVVMVRNPMEVAASLAARNGIDQAKALLLWCNHMVAIEAETRGRRRVFAPYADLISGGERRVTEIMAALSHSPNRVSSGDRAEAAQFLDPAGRHHRVDDAEFLARTDVWPPAQAVYRWLLDAAQGPVDPDPCLDETRRELQRLENLVGPVFCAAQPRPLNP